MSDVITLYRLDGSGRERDRGKDQRPVEPDSGGAEGWPTFTLHKPFHGNKASVCLASCGTDVNLGYKRSGNSVDILANGKSVFELGLAEILRQGSFPKKEISEIVVRYNWGETLNLKVTEDGRDKESYQLVMASRPWW